MPTATEIQTAVEAIEPFMSSLQRFCMAVGATGEEGQEFIKQMKYQAANFADMPVTYEQDGMGKDSIAYLHYFLGSSHWFITEKDVDGGTAQAYGYVILNGDMEMAEFGYISIDELKEVNAELDLNFKPTSIKGILKKMECA